MLEHWELTKEVEGAEKRRKALVQSTQNLLFDFRIDEDLGRVALTSRSLFIAHVRNDFRLVAL